MILCSSKKMLQNACIFVNSAAETGEGETSLESRRDSLPGEEEIAHSTAKHAMQGACSSAERTACRSTIWIWSGISTTEGQRPLGMQCVFRLCATFVIRAIALQEDCSRPLYLLVLIRKFGKSFTIVFATNA